MASKTDNYTFTIWSNAGRYEWIIRSGDDIVERSGQVFTSRGKAKTALMKRYNEIQNAERAA